MYHCGKIGCDCTHTQGCEHGWIFGKEPDRKIVHTKDGGTKVVETIYEVVWPCMNCQPEKARIFANSRNRQELQENLRNRSTFTRQKAYDESEERKTRTL